MVEKNIRSPKGQAAMEYLMTYGWAILVIVIVIAALLFLNPFKAPETCLFQQPGFSCSEAKPQVYVGEDGATKVSMRIYNKQGQVVKLKKVLCTNVASGDITSDNADDFSAEPKSVPAGGSVLFAADTSVTCKDESGNALQLSANSEFKGIIALWYNFDNDPDQSIERTATATLISTVLATGQ
ncbi:TPA: hypothetical protein HA238_01650 [Candidatus Micrarchaeota archaeon]|nr:hypothetical protein [Candidatus Micrarchaeota archaeon]